ncbi:MAG: glycosyltransferase [Gammaproteobacteria bacterium]
MIDDANRNEPVVAYVTKGFPRNSEAFISNEVYLLEQMGLRLKIFALAEEQIHEHHAVVGKIEAKVTYLAEPAGAKDSAFADWLKQNLPLYATFHGKLFRRRPWRYLRALGETLWLSFACRGQRWPIPKKNFYKDFLRAGQVAQEILALGTVRHLHAHFCHGSATMAMLASTMTGIPFSFTAHAKDIYLPKLNPGNLLTRKLRRARFVATCTDANRQTLERLCPEQPALFTIYHGLDIGKFAPRPAAVEHPPLILAVGRMVAKKGFPDLIGACGLLRDRGMVFRCLIVGEPDEHTALVIRRIAELRLADRVSLQGATTQEKLREIYGRCTVFALPCNIVENGDRDGIPNVLAEAMAMGLAVVSTRVSGIPEIVNDSSNGLLVPPQDPVALADALATLLADAALRRRLGAAARETICAVFDSSKTTIELLNLFRACLALAERRPKPRAVGASKQGDHVITSRVG